MPYPFFGIYLTRTYPKGEISLWRLSLSFIPLKLPTEGIKEEKGRGFSSSSAETYLMFFSCSLLCRSKTNNLLDIGLQSIT